MFVYGGGWGNRQNQDWGNSDGGGYNSGYGQGGWGNQNPWDSNNAGGNWGNQGYGDQGGWNQPNSNFGTGYQQGYGGGPMRPNYNTSRPQPYNNSGGGGGYGTGGGGNGGAGSGGPAYNNMGGNQAQAANQRRF